MWRRTLLQYPCYACGAAPDMPCVTTNNRPAHTPHQSRTEQAMHDRWVLLTERDDDERDPS